MADKRSPAYRRWATVYNLKQMSVTRMFLRENHIESFEDLDKRTEDAYVAYRKAGYSREFYEGHRQEITLHKAAKAAFDQLGAEKLSTIRELNEAYVKVPREKKKINAEYRIAKNEMKGYVTAKKNVGLFYKQESVGDKDIITEKMR